MRKGKVSPKAQAAQCLPGTACRAWARAGDRSPLPHVGGAPAGAASALLQPFHPERQHEGSDLDGGDGALKAVGPGLRQALPRGQV